jgi:S-adenosylmethionine uptake transporter
MTGSSPARPAEGALDLLARRRRGVVMMTVAIALLATMDLLVKIASAEFSTLQIVWSRYVGQTIGLFAYAGAAGVLACFRTEILPMHLARAALLLVANVSFMAALRYLPLTEANLVGFASPLLITALTYPVLG